MGKHGKRCTIGLLRERCKRLPKPHRMMLSLKKGRGSKLEMRFKLYCVYHQYQYCIALIGGIDQLHSMNEFLDMHIIARWMMYEFEDGCHYAAKRIKGSGMLLYRREIHEKDHSYDTSMVE